MTAISNSKSADVETLQRAKEALREKYGNRRWFRGVGIGPSESGLVLRLSVDPTVADVADEDIPRSFHGCKIDVVFIQEYKPRVTGR